MLPIPSKPGLGIQINLEALAEFSSVDVSNVQA
jgi:hypothetical protein